MDQGQSRALWGRFTPIIVLTAEISSILAFLGIVVSLGLNSIIFTRWGLRFIDVANPSDILLSGVGLVGVILLHAIAYLIVAAPFALALRFLPEWGARYVLRAIVLLCAAFVFWRLSQSLMTEPDPSSLGSRLAWPLYLAVGLSLAALYTALKRGFAGWALVAEGLVAAVALFVPIAANAYMGAIGTSLYVAPTNPDICPRPLSVNWMGTSALVASCDDAHGATTAGDVFVLDRASTPIMNEAGVANMRAAALARGTRTFDPRVPRDWRRIELASFEGEAQPRDAGWAVYVDQGSIDRQGAIVEAWLLGYRGESTNALGQFYVVDAVAACDSLTTAQHVRVRAVYSLDVHVMFQRQDVRNRSDQEGAQSPWPGDASQALCLQSPDFGDPPAGELAEQLRAFQARYLNP